MTHLGSPDAGADALARAPHTELTSLRAELKALAELITSDAASFGIEFLDVPERDDPLYRLSFLLTTLYIQVENQKSRANIAEGKLRDIAGMIERANMRTEVFIIGEDPGPRLLRRILEKAR